MLYTHTCAICIEDITPKTDMISTLLCNHSYHSECLVEYFIYKYNQHRKEDVYFNYDYHYYHNYKCPICRKHIRCKDIHNIVYNFYVHTKNEYEECKEEFDKLKKEYCINKFKYNIKKMFIKNLDNKIYSDIFTKISEFNKILPCKQHRFNAAKELYNIIHCSCLE